MNRPAGLAGIEFTLTRDGDVWKGTMKMRVPNGDLTPTVSDVQIAGPDISFTATQANGNVLKIKARFDGDKLNGTFETSRDGNKVAEGGFEKTIPFRFSLDESFDVGQDTGSPVIDEYDAKMPFKFSGTLKKVEVKLGADQLSPQKRGELEQLKKDFAIRMQ